MRPFLAAFVDSQAFEIFMWLFYAVLALPVIAVILMVWLMVKTISRREKKE